MAVGRNECLIPGSQILEVHLRCFRRWKVTQRALKFLSLFPRIVHNVHFLCRRCDSRKHIVVAGTPVKDLRRAVLQRKYPFRSPYLPQIAAASALEP